MVDETGQMGLRAPVQLLAALSLIVFLGVLELWLAKTETIGLGGLLVCLVFSVDMLLFSFLRADPAQSWLGLRIETWAAMVYTLLGIVGTIGILLKKWHIPFRRGWLKAKLARK